MRKGELFSLIGHAADRTLSADSDIELTAAIEKFVRSYEAEGNEEGPLPDWAKRALLAASADFMRTLELFSQEDTVGETTSAWVAALVKFCEDVLFLLYPDEHAQKANPVAIA